MMHAFYVIIFEGVCTSVKWRCTLSKSLCVVCGHGAESSYWIIDYQAFSPSYTLAPSPFPASPIRQRALRATQRKTKKERQLADERGGIMEQFFKMLNLVHYFFSFPQGMTPAILPFILLSPNCHRFPVPQWLLPSYLSFFYPLTNTFFLSHTNPPSILPFNLWSPN